LKIKLAFHYIILSCFTLLLTHPKVLANNSDSNSEAFCPQQLPETIDQIIQETTAGSRWGMMIQSSLSETILYQRNPDQFFIPASNVKLFITAAALNELTPQFKLITPIFTQGTAPELQTLQIIGKGNPALNSNDLEQLAETLNQKGVRSIATLILETGYFDSPGINPTWEWEDVYAAYGTAVNSLILDENAVTLTLRPQKVGEVVQVDWDNDIAASQWQLNGEAMTAPANTAYRVELQRKFGTSQLNLSGKLPQDIETDVWQLAIPNPDHYFRDVFLTKLGEQGIKVKQVQFSDSDLLPVAGEPMIELASPAVSQLIQAVNRNSNNLYAEALLKVLLAQTQEAVIKEQLTQLGVSPNHYYLADGSGLSRRNLATPRAIAQLLQGMLNSENFEFFQSSLAVAGVNGTLENRFQGSSLQGNLRGKTGTLTGISALSGYLNPAHYQPLVFSILLNHSQHSASEQRAMIDEIIRLLSQLKNC